MNIPLDAQEILAQMTANQQQIDNLTRNQSLLMQHLLTQGVRNSHIEALRADPSMLRDAFPNAANGTPAPARGFAQLESGATEPTNVTPAKKGRPAHTQEHYRPDVGSRPYELIVWAKAHGGFLDFSKYRQANPNNAPASFLATGLPTIGRKLTEFGVFERISPSIYKLIPTHPAVTAIDNTPPVLPPPPPPAPEPMHAAPVASNDIPLPIDRLKDAISLASVNNNQITNAAFKASQPSYRRAYWNAHVSADFSQWVSTGYFKKTGLGQYKYTGKKIK